MKKYSSLFKTVGVSASADLAVARNRLQAQLHSWTSILVQNFVGISVVAFASFIPLHADDFSDGLDAYHESQYAEAASAFERSLENYETPAARHNLALSLFQQGRPSEAIWQLERALRLDPLNESYRTKLGALRQELGLYQLPATWWQNAANILSQPAWIWIASISFWLLLAAMLIPRIGNFRSSNFLRLLIGITFVSILLSSTAWTIQSNQLASGVIVSDETVPLHHAPASAAPESGLARPGERAHIIDRHSAYLKIETEADITGWIRSEAFRKL